jgi:hypothetical protein
MGGGVGRQASFRSHQIGLPNNPTHQRAYALKVATGSNPVAVFRVPTDEAAA